VTIVVGVLSIVDSDTYSAREFNINVV